MELWVSAQLAEVINIIDVATLTLIGDIAFLPAGFRKAQVTPVDLLITRDGSCALVALRQKLPPVEGARTAIADSRIRGRAMLADALAQYLAARNWRRVLALVVEDEASAAWAAAFERAAASAATSRR